MKMPMCTVPATDLRSKQPAKFEAVRQQVQHFIGAQKPQRNYLD